MAADLELHIVVPGLCGPLAETQSLENNNTVKKWIRCLSRSVVTSSASCVHDVFSPLLNLSISNDFPTAALSMMTHESYDDSLHYMCADPVHLQADIDHAILTSSDDLAIQESDSAIFCDVLNKHFNQDGLFFLCVNKDRWVVASKDKIRLDTTPLSEAIGRNVNFILPKGEDAVSWNRVLTEAQMLMHSHDINTVRETSGRQSVNSLWFHGSGDLPEFSKHSSMFICSNDSALEGLSSHTGSDYIKVPAAFDDYKETLLSQTSDINILHISELEHLVNYSDVNVWLEKFTEVLDAWVYPLIDVANENDVRVMLYPCNNKQYQFSKYDSLKFWRQENLEQHVCKY